MTGGGGCRVVLGLALKLGLGCDWAGGCETFPPLLHSIFCAFCTPKASPDMIRTLFGSQRGFLSPQNHPSHDFDPVWARKRTSTFMLMHVLGSKSPPRHDLTLFGGQRHASTFMLMSVLSPQHQPRHDFDPVWARKCTSTFMLMHVLGSKSPPRPKRDFAISA